jgi:hypothetical protein
LLTHPVPIDFVNFQAPAASYTKGSDGQTNAAKALTRGPPDARREGAEACGSTRHARPWQGTIGAAG